MRDNIDMLFARYRIVGVVLVALARRFQNRKQKTKTKAWARFDKRAEGVGLSPLACCVGFWRAAAGGFVGGLKYGLRVHLDLLELITFGNLMRIR